MEVIAFKARKTYAVIVFDRDSDELDVSGSETHSLRSTCVIKTVDTFYTDSRPNARAPTRRDFSITSSRDVVLVLN